MNSDETQVTHTEFTQYRNYSHDEIVQMVLMGQKSSQLEIELANRLAQVLQRR